MKFRLLVVTLAAILSVHPALGQTSRDGAAPSRTEQPIERRPGEARRPDRAQVPVGRAEGRDGGRRNGARRGEGRARQKNDRPSRDIYRRSNNYRRW